MKDDKKSLQHSKGGGLVAQEGHHSLKVLKLCGVASILDWQPFVVQPKSYCMFSGVAATICAPSWCSSVLECQAELNMPYFCIKEMTVLKCPRIVAGRHELLFCFFVCTYYTIM